MKFRRSFITLGIVTAALAWTGQIGAMLGMVPAGEVAAASWMVLLWSLCFLCLGGVKSFLGKPARLLLALHLLFAVAGCFLVQQLLYFPLAISVVVSVAVVVWPNNPLEPTR